MAADAAAGRTGGLRRLITRAALGLCAVAWLGPRLPAEVIEVPFDFLHNQIVLRVAVNGTGPHNFVIDTGTFASTIDLGLARRLRLPLAAARSEGRGAGRTRTSARTAVLDSVQLGELRVQGLPAAALDLSGVSRELGRPLDGVLGHNFLAERVVQIDYFHRRIRFLDSSGGHAEPSPGRAIFPMQFHSGTVLPLLEACYLNGTRLPITLDTGSSLGLILFPRAVERLGLGELAATGVPMAAAGYRGKASLTKGWLRSFVLDTIELGAIEVAYVRGGYGDAEDPSARAGNLGNAVLQDFTVTLDYRSKTIVLERLPE